MTPKQLPLIVADTTIFLSVLKNEEGRVHAAESFLDGNGQNHSVVLSSVVELELFAFPSFRRADSLIREERREASRQLETYLSTQKLIPGDLSPRAVRFARTLIVDQNIKFPDAAIVGTGLAVNAVAVYTWDDTLIRACSDLAGIRVAHPPTPPPTMEIASLFDRPLDS